MARKSEFEKLLEDLSHCPWWVSVGVAVVVYTALGVALPMYCSGGDCHLVVQAIAQLEWLPLSLAALFLIPACQSVFRRFKSRRLLHRTRSIESIRSLPWKEFENLLGEYYRRAGYKVIENYEPGPDGGVDLRLTNRDDNRHLVQCKNWRNQSVGVKVVRELLGVVTAEKAFGGIVVISGEFTHEAKRFAADVPIQLVDGKRLVDMIGTIHGGQIEQSVTSESRDEVAFRRDCPRCGGRLVLRTARRGRNAGTQFYGCLSYPKCRYIVPLPN